ncbi:hypothetical protein CLV81_1235 [Flagellimonas meridianipacifica]|uniref:Uncharacterized protein n=2 Tax=Flagellimonas meridianipacifica TaxID=1080225 RepID=A0A2T0MI29_9FLAO|nr:hypothetical protein CLV81_1235 [Allomuricauda pacifica]
METSKKLEDFRKKLGELQLILTNYLNMNSTIPHLEATREIAWSIQELGFKHKSLVQQFSDTIGTGRSFSILSHRLSVLESESYSLERVLDSLIKT